MEYRTQTYIGATQLLAVFSGSLILRGAVNGLEDMLIPGLYDDRLRILGPLSLYSWLLVLVPIGWMFLTIRGERSDLWWASKRMTVASGIVILLGIASLFGWAGIRTMEIPYR